MQTVSEFEWGLFGTPKTAVPRIDIEAVIFIIFITRFTHFTGPDSLVVRAPASGAVGRGFAPRSRHTKGGKNGTGSSLADARNKRAVPGRYKKAGGYLILVMSQ